MSSATNLTLLALLLGACGTPADLSPLATGGKAEAETETGGVTVVCNGDDMIITPDSDNPGQFVGTISHQGAIDWFEQQSKEPASGPSYNGGVAWVDKQFPWYVSIKPDPADTTVRLLVISDLKDYGNGRYLTSEPGTEVKARDGGYDVTIKGMKMPNSHTNIRYTIGHWFFDSCATPTPEAIVACNDGDLTLSADDEVSDQFLATISNQGVIDWFEQQSKEPACGPSYYGGTPVCVDKQLPWYVSIKIDPEAHTRRLLVISNLKAYGNGRYMTSEPGTELKARDGGYDVTINGMKMPNSHTNIRYTVGHWYFERCTP